MVTEDNPSKDIMLEPSWAFLEDGRGAQVLMLGGVHFVDKDGRKCLKLRVKTDDYCRKRYKWRLGNEVDDNGCKEIIFLEQDLIPLNIFDDANKKWLYTKDFNHQPTDLSDREIILQDKLTFAQKRNILLEAKIIRLTEQLEDANLSTGKFLSQGAEIFERAAGAVASAVNKNKEGDQQR